MTDFESSINDLMKGMGIKDDKKQQKSNLQVQLKKDPLKFVQIKMKEKLDLARLNRESQAQSGALSNSVRGASLGSGQSKKSELLSEIQISSKREAEEYRKKRYTSDKSKQNIIRARIEMDANDPAVLQIIQERNDRRE